MNQQTLARITSVSRLIALAATLAMIGLCLLAVAMAAMPTAFGALARIAHPGAALSGEGGALRHVALLAAAALPVCAALYTLSQIRALFSRFARGDIFSAAPPRHIKRIGLGLLAAAIANPLSKTLSILILSAANPPGQKILSISVGSTEYMLLIFAGMMITLGWIQSAAADLAAENRQFI